MPSAASDRPRDWAGRALPLPYSILGQVKLLRGQLARSRRVARQRRRGSTLVGQRPGARRQSRQSLFRGACGGRRRACDSPPPRSASSWRAGWTRASSAPPGVALAAGAARARRDPERAVESLVSSSGGRGAAAHPGGLAGPSGSSCSPAAGSRSDSLGAAERAAGGLTEAAAAALQLRTAASMADRAAAAVDLEAGRADRAAECALAAAAAADEVGAPVEAALVADARGPRTRARRADRARGDLRARAGRAAARGVRGASISGGRGARASKPRPARLTAAPVRARPTGPAWRR